ncbi:MAG: VWA domain-containing protein [Nannocystaceae bacterium]|nr:VWA domain-containing protein [Nannocystaceae bacterium]
MHTRARATWVALSVIATGAIGCGDVRDDDAEATTLPATVSQGEAGSGGGDSSSSSGAVTAEADSGVTKLDVGAETGMMSADDGGNMPGCKKVDFLFVIDNSGSMSDEQLNLIASFPQFISTIQSTLDEAQDYHVMVIDTDAWVYEQCPGLCNLFMTCLVDPQFECGVTEPMECEDILGAGVTWPRGAQASNEDCMFASGARYMDESEPDLSAAFQCAARVGTGATSDPEKPMESMVAAVTPNTPAADCNTGFVRDDAILVVTFITDEDDAPSDGSSGTVDGWRQALIAAKKGDPNAVVVLGLFGDGDQPGAICPPFNPDAASGAEPSPRLREFVDSWGDRGVAGSVCAASYQEFFEQAVGVIDTTCDEYIPPAG